MNFSEALLSKAKKIQLINFDVDGVLTDGKIIYHSDGNEIKAFHVHDGAAIKLLMQYGLEIAVITGRSSEPVHRRVQELGIKHYYHGIKDKLTAFEDLKIKSGFKAEQIAHVGDDLPDLCLFREAGLAIGVPNGHPALIPDLDYTTQTAAGGGVAREIAELLLKSRNVWESITSPITNSK